MELEPFIKTDFESGLFVITFNRGEKGNPLNLEFLSSLEKALENGFSRPEARVLLIRSNTDRFCVGMDLAALAGADRADKLKDAILSYSRVLSSIYDCGKPIICSVSGEVRAGGVGIVCACDIVCATRESSFNLSEVLFGLVPANVMPYLLGLRVPPAKARYLALTNREVSGEEAHTLGIVDELVERDKIEASLKNRVRQLLRSSPSALARVKDMTADMTWKGIDYTRNLAVETLSEIAADPSIIEAIRAFAEGETPAWFSKFKPTKPLFLEESP